MSEYDKYERAPGGAAPAKCRGCGEKIQKGTVRIGVGYRYYYGNSDRYKWSYRYYHNQCLPVDQRATLKLESASSQSAKLGSTIPVTPELVNATLANDLHRQDARASAKRQLVFETRGKLREDLRHLRFNLAKRKNQQAYMIFYDKTLDDIVANLPVNDRELMRCWGIKKKKCDEFGSLIIRIVREYKRREAEEQQRNSESKANSDDVEIGPVLSVEETIKQRMEENRRSGNEYAIL